MKTKEFQPVECYYHLSMHEPMLQALNSIQEDGLHVEGFTITKEGNKTKLTITIEQREQFLIQFGIRTGKLIK